MAIFKPGVPDLDTQFEDLLHQVFESERRERINDQVDQAVRVEEERAKRERRRKAE